MAAEVRARVLELYLHQDPAVKQAADAVLQQFQASDVAWGVAQELLADADDSVKFFGAQTLYTKVQRVAKGFQEIGDADLLALAQTLRQHLVTETLPPGCRQRLALALAAVAVHLCTTAWPTAVADVLAMAEAQPRSAWSVILAMPEQLSAVVHTYVKTDRRTQALLAGAPALLGAVGRLEVTAEGGGDEEATGTLSDSPFSLALQSLTQWSKVMGMELLRLKGFAGHLAGWLQGPAGSSEPVLELLIEVLQNSPGAFATYAAAPGGDRQCRPGAAAPELGGLIASVVGTMSSLLPALRQMVAKPPVPLDEADAARLGRWARVAFVLVEAYTQILWAETQAAEVVVTFLASCFLVHPHVAQSVFELWAILKDANRDGMLPAGVLDGLLVQLAPPCVRSFVTFSRYDSPFSEDAASLVQLREAQQEIVVDIFCIAAGTPQAAVVLGLLQEQLQRSQAAKDWHGVEVAWYAFNGIAEAIIDEPVLPDAYQLAIQSIFLSEVSQEEHCTTAAILLRTCGPHFERSLRQHLAPTVQWLVGKVPQIPAVAGEAVQEICGYAGQHLVPHLAEFLKVVEATAPTASADVDASLHGALAGIARSLPVEQAAEAFVTICQSTSQALASGVDVEGESGRRLLHRCTCRLLRGSLVMEQAGSPEDAAGPGPTAAAKAAATGLATVLIAVWPSLAPPCQRLLCAGGVSRDAPRGKPIFDYSDAAVQVNVLALLRCAAKAACDAAAGGPQLAACVLQFAGACGREGQLACLYSVSVLAGSPGFASTLVLPQLEGICQAAQAHVQAGRPAEGLIPFLELASALAAAAGDALFQSAQLPMLTQLSTLAVRSSEQDILKPVLLFLQKLLMTRTAVPAEMAQEVMQACLANFHLWPRSMGAQCFKLISACLERHEAAFLQMALSPGFVPSIAGLPPAEQALAQRAFRQLRGPRLRAFLGDLGAVARGDTSLDMLQAHAVEG